MSIDSLSPGNPCCFNGLSNCTKLQLRALMATNSKKKNGISGRLVKSMLSNRFQWTNLHEQPQNGPVTDDFMHSPRKWPLATLSCGKHCTALSSQDSDRLCWRPEGLEINLRADVIYFGSRTFVSVSWMQSTKNLKLCRWVPDYEWTDSLLFSGTWLLKCGVQKQHQTHVGELAANKIPVVQCVSCAQQHTLFYRRSIRGHADGINCFDCWMSWISRRSSIHKEPASKRGQEGASSDSAQVQSSPIKTKVEWDFDFAHDLEDSKSTSGDPVWEVEHLSLSVGCVRNKRQFHTDRRNWKIFFW